jgi:arylsulfatase
MKKKRVLKALTSTLLLAMSARLSLHAQATKPYQGVVGRTLTESKEWWPGRYTNFHTTAIRAPTRAALLTGRNSASVHVSGF